MLARTLTLVPLLLLTADAAHAHRGAPPPTVHADVSLRCGAGACADVRHRGQRWYVGEPGQRYVIAIRNPTSRWVEAVVSVDGRNVVDGHQNHANSRGYLIAPHGRVEIDGWRTSRSSVAAFRFTSVADSYAGRMGTPGDAGTIRVALYPEARRRPVLPEPWGAHDHDRPRAERGAAKSADAAPHRGHRRVPQNLGTQYGEHRYSPVQTRDFERANWHRPDQTVVLRYDDRAGLRRRGILRPPQHWTYEDPHDHWVAPPPRR